MRPRMSTFSIVAYDPAKAEWGVAVQSKFLAVGAAVPWAKAGSGSIATQAWANLTYGPQGLKLLEQGLSADEVVKRLTDADEGRDHRQLGVVDTRGNAAAYTGVECLHWAGHLVGRHYCCQGNILAGPEVGKEMARVFESAQGELADRLLAALFAGQEAGGDSRGQESAALLVVRESGGYGGFSDRLIDLRVDDHERPIAELERLLKLHRLYFGETKPEDLLPIEGAIARELKAILVRSGHSPKGPVDEHYDEATQGALRKLIGMENLEERFKDEAFIDRVALEYLRERYSPR
ncbi:MAG: DUF1028 domain-containing protein [Chloroflexi bacterium]|nr:DUF1028 domain-containing protein [Chloroflexota bacterium]